MALDTVLVVDEQRTAQETAATLNRFSYRALLATSSEQALGILKANAPVELVLSEILMPEGMSGISLAREIRASHPHTLVMLMTATRHQALDPSIPLLIKPFAAFTLIERVQQVLADAHRSVESLNRTFEANRAGLAELAAAANSVAETVRQSREQRMRRFCSRLRTAVARPTIVVAEDDSSLRYSICHYLGHHGFRVLEASDGQEVLNITRSHHGAIEVLVTDFRMPGLNGVELANTVAAERPQTSLIFMTGDDAHLPGRTLRKPFELDDLLAEIVGVLADW